MGVNWGPVGAGRGGGASVNWGALGQRWLASPICPACAGMRGPSTACARASVTTAAPCAAPPATHTHGNTQQAQRPSRQPDQQGGGVPPVVQLLLLCWPEHCGQWWLLACRWMRRAQRQQPSQPSWCKRRRVSGPREPLLPRSMLACPAWLLLLVGG